MSLLAADVDAFADRLRRAERVVLVGHVRPDGDSLGTTAALALGLTLLGKKATCLALSQVAKKYAFLYNDVTHLVEVDPNEVLAEADTLLVCDTGTWSQLPTMQAAVEAFGGQVLVLDHHQTQEPWGDARLVDTEAGAAAEVAARVLAALRVEMTPEIAQRLFVAAATDTGWFSYSNASARTYRLAADCIEAGVDPDALAARLYRDEPAARLRLKTRALQSLRWHADGRLTTMQLTRADYEAADATPEDAEDLINEPMKVGTVEASLLVGEPPVGAVVGDAIKVSLRSKGGVDCAALLQTFGGGGHARAAGARVQGTVEEVRDVVVRAVLETL